VAGHQIINFIVSCAELNITKEAKINKLVLNNSDLTKEVLKVDECSDQRIVISGRASYLLRDCIELGGIL